MSVNDKIRLIREAKGLTQEQVAEKMEMSPNAYGNIERGDNDPKLSKLQKIAEIFEIELSELISLSEKENLTINFSNYQENGKFTKSKVYISSSNSELEKQQLIIELKDKELAMQQREIENLKIQITQLQEINVLLKNK
jgi:transcriptional regulator with XRE-family HTH domain